MLKYNQLSKKQSTDTGMALVLICLLIGNVFFSMPFLNIVAIVCLITTMSVPSFLKPVAFLWLNLSYLLGGLVSKVLLTGVFFMVLVPMGMLVQVFKNDTLNLKAFKATTATAFNKRQHKFSKLDLENPY